MVTSVHRTVSANFAHWYSFTTCQVLNTIVSYQKKRTLSTTKPSYIKVSFAQYPKQLAPIVGKMQHILDSCNPRGGSTGWNLIGRDCHLTWPIVSHCILNWQLQYSSFQTAGNTVLCSSVQWYVIDGYDGFFIVTFLICIYRAVFKLCWNVLIMWQLFILLSVLFSIRDLPES